MKIQFHFLLFSSLVGPTSIMQRQRMFQYTISSGEHPLPVPLLSPKTKLALSLSGGPCLSIVPRSHVSPLFLHVCSTLRGEIDKKVLAKPEIIDIIQLLVLFQTLLSGQFVLLPPREVLWPWSDTRTSRMGFQRRRSNSRASLPKACFRTSHGPGMNFCVPFICLYCEI